jgi:glycoside/pentoside/hexuronide:cation symporter, GPH family
MAKRKEHTKVVVQPIVAIRPPLRVLILYALGQLGWSLGSYAVGNLLIYFYMPPEQGQVIFPSFLYQGAVLGVLTLIGILSAGGRFWDALVDPLVANWSDRKQSSIGKRRWFMLVGAIPFALFGALVFFPIVPGESAGNFVWLALIIGLYYSFFAFYVIPYTALMAELGHTPADRMLISTLSSVTWAVGFMVGNSAYALQTLFENNGHSPLEAFQKAIIILQIVAVVFMLMPALFLNERRYAKQSTTDHGIWKALQLVFANHNFRQFLYADLLYWLSLTFIQLGIGFYTTLLFGLDKSHAFSFSLLSFVCSFLFYAPVNMLARKMGKKRLILFSFLVFAVLFGVLGLARMLPVSGLRLLYALGVLSAFPLASFGILPNAVIGDEVEKEAARSGQQMSGMFFGVRAFVMKVGVSAANLIFPSLLLLGKSAENTTGVQLTALAALLFCLMGWQLFGKYEE